MKISSSFLVTLILVVSRPAYSQSIPADVVIDRYDAAKPNIIATKSITIKPKASGEAFFVPSGSTFSAKISQEGAVLDSDELLVLKAIYDSLGGATWTNKSGWPAAGSWPATATAAQMDAWYGIVVTNGDITGLALNNNNLTGQIPKMIGKLSKLNNISFQGNQIGATVPSSIGSLTELVTLQLNNNQLSGSIPSQIGNLTKLVTLSLNNNLLTGSIPSSIGSLSALQYLYLYVNQLSGSIPASLGSLPNLLTLHLATNQLSGEIPPEIGNLPKLTSLYLHTNQLTGSIPSSFGQLNRVTHLWLYSNRLSGELPSALSGMASLQQLHVGGNDLTGSIPESFSSLTQMYQFMINNNRFGGQLRDDFFSNWAKLAILNISGNSFEGAFPSSIGTCTKMSYLRCDYNKFESLPASLLTLPLVTSINFDYNELKVIPNFANQVNKNNIGLLRVTYNRLDFAQLEPIINASIRGFAFAFQNPINDYLTVNLSVGSDLVLRARSRGAFTSNIKWEKLNGNTWQDISSANADPLTGNTYRIVNATDAAKGRYRWSCTSTKATGMTLASEPIEAKTQQQFVLDNWAFQYKYDGRRRMTHKKVPGADWVYMVYDERDRLVLTQDGEQRKSNRWTFTKYDALNRPVMTGIYTHGTLLAQPDMQAIVNTFYSGTLGTAKQWFETYVGAAGINVHGYDNKSFPTVGNPSDYLTVTYYDNYSFKSLLGSEYDYVNDALSETVNGHTYQQGAAFTSVIGQVTGTKVKVLEGNGFASGAWLNTVSYYDDKYRVLQTVGDNSYGGIDRTSNLYDFVGKVLKTKSSWSVGESWKDVVNVSVSGTGIARSANSSGWNAGAASTSQLAAGVNGWAECTASETNTARMFGLSPANTDANFNTIAYAWYLINNGTLQIYESGQLRGSFGNYRSGDVLRIERVGTSIQYKVNGILTLLCHN